MDHEKTEAYAALAAQLMELHASVALLAQNVEKMARTDEEVTSMTRIFNGVYVSFPARTLKAGRSADCCCTCRFKNAAQQTNYRESPAP